MKKIVLALAMCSLVLAIPLIATAGNGPYNKVTGDMWFTNPGYGWANFTFSGHDVGAPTDDKGTAYYADGDGYWYGTATDVTVTSTSGIMYVTVTSSTHPAVPVGSPLWFTFYDMGEPGTADYFTFAGGSYQYLAEAGNIQIHYYG
jgi:hypothetical protein